MGPSKTWLKIKNPKAPKKITMRKYPLSVLAIIAGAIIAAETAVDANGNTAKILIPKDAFTIEE